MSELQAVAVAAVAGVLAWIAAGVVLVLPVALALELPARSVHVLDAAFLLGLAPGCAATIYLSERLRRSLP